MTDAPTEVGRVLGTEDSNALDFWVALRDTQYLQLDDVVCVESAVPGTESKTTHYGIVDMVRSRHEGATFESDVFRAADGLIPIGLTRAAHVSVTRVGRLPSEEILVPPPPGAIVRRAEDEARSTALYFDQMKNRFVLGLSRDGQPTWGNLDFLDGTRGAHVNISGISGVATKTSCALFLLHGLFNSDETRESIGANTRALIFNVKGEDLLHIDRPNAAFADPEFRTREEAKYSKVGLSAMAFDSVALWAPPKARGLETGPDVYSRQDDSVQTYFWTLRRFCAEGLLPFLFADAERETNQLQFAVTLATNYLRKAVTSKAMDGEGWVELGEKRRVSFQDLVDFIAENEDEVFPQHVRIAPGTVQAFIRRLYATIPAVAHLIQNTNSREEEERGTLNWGQKNVNVVHVAPLHDVAMRFVVGVTLRRLMQDKVNSPREPIVFVVLDELNKYAPREGWSPIKETILDIAERGRSLGVILIGAQQTASEVERRVVANASFRIVGRLDAAESQRAEYGFLTSATKGRASLLKPGSMFVHQPEIPIPLLIQLPFPAWATRHDEVDKATTRSKWR